jgi:hypothetical protein
MAEQWRIVGDFVDFCKCRVPCPCSWGQPPTEGDCDGVIAYRVREGNYGDVTLDGLNVVGVLHFEGNIWEEGTRMNIGLILDEGADEGQREALQTIFGGQAGGWPQVFAETAVGEVLGIDFAPIELAIADDLSSWSLSVPGRVDGSTEVLTGPTTRPGKPVHVNNVAAAEPGPGSGPMTYGIASADRADAFGFTWDWAGRSSKHIPFEWSSDDQF